jgi:hypothetical protein
MLKCEMLLLEFVEFTNIFGICGIYRSTNVIW